VRSCSRRVAFQALVLAASLAVGARSTAAGELRDLGAVENFKTRFNHDIGKPRLLLLLSPT
jgi:hypothetical protein